MLQIDDNGQELTLHEISLVVIEGLIMNYFGKRGPGRPRHNSEHARIKKGLRLMLKAAKISISPEQELFLMTRLMNKSLFDGDCL
jgi:hypothetical protein